MLMVVPTCKKHNSQNCMDMFYIGDGANMPLQCVWLCKREMMAMDKVWPGYAQRFNKTKQKSKHKDGGKRKTKD